MRLKMPATRRRCCDSLDPRHTKSAWDLMNCASMVEVGVASLLSIRSEIARRFTAVAGDQTVKLFRVDFGEDETDAAVGQQAVQAAQMIGMMLMRGALQVENDFRCGRVVRLHPVDRMASCFGDGDRLRGAVGDIAHGRGATSAED